MLHSFGYFLLILISSASFLADSAFAEDLASARILNPSHQVSFGTCSEQAPSARIEIANEQSLLAAMKAIGCGSGSNSGGTPGETRSQFQLDPKFVAEYQSGAASSLHIKGVTPLPRTSTQTYNPASWQKSSSGGVIEEYAEKYKNGIPLYASERGNIYVDPRDKKFKYRLKW